ncbi:hypothetical protein BDB01DRAFT_873291 [Pilobolus umbonatus]|nr:hypothetical protein BDB01DRAFT_873291 [Pilobolus umbonatus]
MTVVEMKFPSGMSDMVEYNSFGCMKLDSLSSDYPVTSLHVIHFMPIIIDVLNMEEVVIMGVLSLYVLVKYYLLKVLSKQGIEESVNMNMPDKQHEEYSNRDNSRSDWYCRGYLEETTISNDSIMNIDTIILGQRDNGKLIQYKDSHLLTMCLLLFLLALKTIQDMKRKVDSRILNTSRRPFSSAIESHQLGF